MRVFAQGRDICLGKANLLKRYGQPHLLVKGGVALKVLGIARIGKQYQHAQAHDLAMQVGALTRNAAGGVVERVRHARVVVIIVLVGQVRDIARVDNDVERDLLDGLARQILAHILKTLHTIGKQRLGAGVGECQAKTGGVLQITGARGVLDLGLLGQGIAYTGPEVLCWRLGDDLGVDEDVRGAVGVRIALERAVVVVDNGNGGRGGAVGADRRHGKDDLLELDGRRLDGIERLAAAASNEHVGFLAGGGVYDLGDIGTRTVGTVDARLQDLDIGTFKCRLDSRQRRSQGSLAANDGDFLRAVLRQCSWQLGKAILANGVVAHSNCAHSSLLSFDKVLSGILLLVKACNSEKFRTYKTSVEGFLPTRNVLAYTA